MPLSYYLYTFWWEIYCLLNCHFSQLIHSFILFSFKIFVFNYQKFIRNLSKPRHRFLWYYPVSVCSTRWICKVYILLWFSPKYSFFNFFLLWRHNFFFFFWTLINNSFIRSFVIVSQLPADQFMLFQCIFLKFLLLYLQIHYFFYCFHSDIESILFLNSGFCTF